MSRPTLLVLAAGRGSRYGGTKQVADVGPAGETLLEYAIYDARRAGFERIAILTRADLVDDFSALVERLPRDLEYQVLTQPATARTRAGRVISRSKPWGTVHAVLAAQQSFTSPFAIVNADDFYGRGAFELARVAVDQARATGVHALVGMRLDETLSESGPVARGVCVTRADELVWLDEVRDVERTPSGIHGRFPDGVRVLTGAEIASMNCWVFSPGVFDGLAAVFEEFLDAKGADDQAEAPLPEAINTLVQARRARVKVVEAPGPWFGLTHPADRPKVVEGLLDLTAQGVYPTPLWK